MSLSLQQQLYVDYGSEPHEHTAHVDAAEVILILPLSDNYHLS